MNGFFGSKSPLPNEPCSLHLLGRPCPDSKTKTRNRLESPRNAIPVGMLSPEAKTETVKPSGTTMSFPLSGSNNAVLSGQSRFMTVAAAAKFGSAKNGVKASAAIRICKRFCRKAFIPSLQSRSWQALACCSGRHSVSQKMRARRSAGRDEHVHIHQTRALEIYSERCQPENSPCSDSRFACRLRGQPVQGGAGRSRFQPTLLRRVGGPKIALNFPSARPARTAVCHPAPLHSQCGA